MTDLVKTQVTAVLTAARHNLSVVTDQLASLDDVDGVDVSKQVTELTEALTAIDDKLKELS